MNNPHSSFIHTMNQLDENYSADLLDAWADLAYQQDQAMREEMPEPTPTQELTYANPIET
jgi:hypothetical protein